ncbi:MAG: hypothetical protein ABFR95_09805 [Actinomycetota bacterium]
MVTKTIRVDEETHAKLVELSQEADASLIDTVADAAEALWRRRFAEKITRQYEELRKDPEAWQDYLDEMESTHVTDGIL